MAQVIRFDYARNRLRRTGCAPKSAYTLELIRVLNQRTDYRNAIPKNRRNMTNYNITKGIVPSPKVLTRKDLVDAGFVIKEPKQ